MVIFYVVAVIVGLMVGSFLDVCIYRIPLLLRGRCRYCKNAIGDRTHGAPETSGTWH